LPLSSPPPSPPRRGRGTADGIHHGWGGVGAGIAAGVIGGALAAATSPLWAPGYYGYGPDYYAPGYAYAPAYGYDTYAYEPDDSGSVAACEARFKSYDPASQTYLGYDGLRHSCP
jgi:hypothetical protein